MANRQWADALKAVEEVPVGKDLCSFVGCGMPFGAEVTFWAFFAANVLPTYSEHARFTPPPAFSATLRIFSQISTFFSRNFSRNFFLFPHFFSNGSSGHSMTGSIGKGSNTIAFICMCVYFFSNLGKICQFLHFLRLFPCCFLPEFPMRPNPQSKFIISF